MVELLPTIEVRLADGTACVINESDFDASLHRRVVDAPVADDASDGREDPAAEASPRARKARR